jgi:hypothetical protein
MLIACITGFVQPVRGADRPDKRQLLAQARAAYYSLDQRGLDSFAATLTPNWEVVLSASGTAVAEEGMRLLNGLHFAMTMDRAGKVVVTHSSDTPAPNPTVQSGYDQIFAGMEQVVGGFFATYRPFMILSPFPEVDSEYTLEDFENGYRLIYKEGTSSVITRLTKTFAIIDLPVNAVEFDSVIRPTFSTTADGYVMSGYEAYYKPKTGTGVTLLTGTIDHEVVDGFRLPKRLHFDSSVDGVANKTEILFTGYLVKKR